MEVNEESMYICYLESLPVEVIEMICRHLNAQDVAACCATSRTLRDVFGCGSVWKGRCDTSLAEYLAATPCKVTPHFASPEDPDGTLSPLSYWRVAYMRENHLWNNWRTGNYVEERLIISTAEYSHRDLCLLLSEGTDLSPITKWRLSCLKETYSYSYASFDEEYPYVKYPFVKYLLNELNLREEMFNVRNVYFLNNDIVIVEFNGRLGFFNVSEPVHTRAADDIQVFTDEYYSVTIVSEHNVVILLCGSLVQIYKVDLLSKTTTLENVFFYDESQKLNIKGPNDITKIIEDRNAREPYGPAVCGIERDRLVFVSPEDSKIHIWNLLTGVKIREAGCPLQGHFQEMNTSENLIFFQTVEAAKTSIHIYDVDKVSFLPSIFLPENDTLTDLQYYLSETDSELYFGPCVIDAYIAVPSVSFSRVRGGGPLSLAITVLNYLTSEILINHQIVRSFATESVRGNFLFSQEGSLNMFCPVTKALRSTPISSSSLSFRVLNQRFIAVQIDEERWQLYEVTDTFKETNVVLHCDTTWDFISSPTKIITDLTILKTFW